MSTKKDRLTNSKLYIVFNPEDAGRCGATPEEMVHAFLQGGADIIQLRDKKTPDQDLIDLASDLRKITQSAGKLFIVNDRPSLARASGADGVHLGQKDGSIMNARALLGPDSLVGRSTHSVSQALNALEEGADYIGFGPIFQTPTKPDYPPVGLDNLKRVSQKISIPFFAIGSIDQENIESVITQGASRVAVVRAAIRHTDIRLSVSELKKKLMQNVEV